MPKVITVIAVLAALGTVYWFLAREEPFDHELSKDEVLEERGETAVRRHVADAGDAPEEDAPDAPEPAGDPPVEDDVEMPSCRLVIRLVDLNASEGDARVRVSRRSKEAASHLIAHDPARVDGPVDALAPGDADVIEVDVGRLVGIEPRPESLAVELDHPSHPGAFGMVDLPRGGGAPEVLELTLTMHPLLVARGTVVGSDGLGVGNVRVVAFRFRDAIAVAPEPEPVAFARTDARGTFSLEARSRARYAIVAATAEVSPATRVVDLLSRHELVLEPMVCRTAPSFTGTIRSDEPLPQICVVRCHLEDVERAQQLDFPGLFYKWLDGRAVVERRSDRVAEIDGESGRFSVFGLPDVEYRISADIFVGGGSRLHPDVVARASRVRRAPAEGVLIDIASPALRVETRADDEPVPGTELTVTPDGGTPWCTRSDRSGTATFRVPSDVPVEISATHPHYEEARERIAALPRSGRREVLFELRRREALDLEVRLEGETEGIVAIDTAFPDTEESRRVSVTTTRKGAVFRQDVHGLEPGVHRVVLSPRFANPLDTFVHLGGRGGGRAGTNYFLPHEVEVRLTRDHLAVIEVEFARGGHLWLEARNPSAEFLAAECTIRDSEGRTHRRKYVPSGMDGATPQPRLGATRAGARTDRPLPPGDYEVTITAPDGRGKTLSVSVSSGKTTEVVAIFD